jgi:hypothetical protein
MTGRKPIFLFFKILMAFVYLILGVAILSSHKLLLPVSNSVRPWLGILLLLYGSLRVYTLVKNSRSDEAN